MRDELMINKENIFTFQCILNYIQTQQIKRNGKDYSLQIKDLVFQLLILCFPQIRDYFFEDFIIVSKEELKKRIYKLRKKIFVNKYDYRLLIKYQFETLAAYLSEDLSSLEYLYMFNFSRKNNNVELLNVIPEYTNFKSYVAKINSYFALPRKNIVICGTMSAGKSSFINALAEAKILPARNEATTAKITSILDNDYLNEFCGYYTEKEKIKVLNRVESHNIDILNDNDSVDSIFLQGNLGKLNNTENLLTIYDTPGTNNSSNDEHFRITSEFINNIEIDVLIYVANICYIKTTDELEILNEIKEIAQKNRKMSLIFVLNKTDKIETQDEQVVDILNRYKTHLCEIGFEKFDLLAVSSRAALLTKMVLADKADLLTDSEVDDFNGLFKKFMNRLDLSGKETKMHGNKENVYIIDGIDYKSDELQNVYIKTGMYEIEKRIESLIKERIIC